MAQPACASFAYNAVMAACFLKRGGGRATCISPTSVCTEQVGPGVRKCGGLSLKGFFALEVSCMRACTSSSHAKLGCIARYKYCMRELQSRHIAAS